MFAAIDRGALEAEQRLTELTRAIVTANEDAARLSNETGPALIAALVQVAKRARMPPSGRAKAIAEIIPESAGKLPTPPAARRSNARCARRSRNGCADVEQVAERAVETARAGDRPPHPADAVDGPERSRARGTFERTREASARKTATISRAACRC